MQDLMVAALVLLAAVYLVLLARRTILRLKGAARPAGGCSGCVKVEDSESGK